MYSYIHYIYISHAYIYVAIAYSYGQACLIQHLYNYFDKNLSLIEEVTGCWIVKVIRYN